MNGEVFIRNKDVTKPSYEVLDMAQGSVVT